MKNKKCPYKQKQCKLNLMYYCNKRNFVCSGIASKGTKYNKDIIWLCLKGESMNRRLEMTPHEASLMISVLGSSLGDITPKILKKIQNKKGGIK